MRPAIPAGATAPAKQGAASALGDRSLDSYKKTGVWNEKALQALFGPTPTGRTRGYVHELYGYMPFGDGYGGAQIGGADWWSFHERSPYMSTHAWGPAAWMPERPESTCPPDCGGDQAPGEVLQQQPI